jgi:S1-C subfamily serine protease
MVAAAIAAAAVAGVAQAFAASGSAGSRRATADGAIVDINTNLGYQGGAAAGTGIVLSSSGIVLTNNHVIRGATSVRATDVNTGRSYKATVLGYSVANDVAVLKLSNASGLSTAPIGDSGSVRVGDTVTAMGNAGGVGGTPSSATGKVTALGRSITAGDGDGSSERLSGLLQIDAELQPGDSGGPLVDSNGRVIGMNTAASVGFEFQGTASTEGYAIPIAHALAVAQKIQAGESSATIHVGPTALLGVSVQSADPYGYDSSGGALVVGVAGNTPAGRAGISEGDVITGLGGKSISTPSALSAAMLQRAPGAQVAVSWVDQFGSSHRATVRLASGPPQ